MGLTGTMIEHFEELTPIYSQMGPLVYHFVRMDGQNMQTSAINAVQPVKIAQEQAFQTEPHVLLTQAW